jgi:hypothetical protein
MSNSRIKIGADVSDIKKSIFDLSRTIDKNLTRRQAFKLFDDDTRKFIKEEAGKAMEAMSEHMTKISKQSAEYRTQLERGNISEKEALRIKKEIIRIEKERATIQKDINRLQKEPGAMEGMVQGAKGAFGRGRIGRGLGALHSRGGMLGGLAGGIARMGPMGLLGAGALAAGGFALSRGREGFQAFEGQASERLQMRARGIRDVMGRNQALQGLGYSPQDIIGTQRQALGVFGTQGAQADATQRRMEFSRFAGVDPEEMQQTFSGSQSAGGFRVADRTFEEFRATILANKLEEAIGPYMEATSDLLGEINRDGLTLTSGAIQALSAIAGRGEIVSQQQAARILGSVDQRIRGATGDQAAFFMTAFARQGLGGGMLGGAQEAMQLGLFGASEQRLRDLQEAGIMDERTIQLYRNMGLSGDQGGLQTRVEGIQKELDRVSQQFGPEDSDQKRLAEGFVLQKMLGTGSALAGFEAFGALQKAAAAEDPESRQKFLDQLKDVTQDPELRFREKLTSLMDNVDGNIVSIAATGEAVKQELGQRVAPTMMRIREVMISADRAVNYLAQQAGMENEQEKAVRDVVEGRSRISQSDFANMDVGDLQTQTEFYQKALEQLGSTDKQLERSKYLADIGGPGSSESVQKQIEQNQILTQELKQVLEILVNETKRQTGVITGNGRSKPLETPSRMRNSTVMPE